MMLMPRCNLRFIPPDNVVLSLFFLAPSITFSAMSTLSVLACDHGNPFNCREGEMLRHLIQWGWGLARPFKASQGLTIPKKNRCSLTVSEGNSMLC